MGCPWNDPRASPEGVGNRSREPGQGRRPAGGLVTVVVSVVCLAAVAGLAVWGFGLLRDEVEQSGADRPTTVRESTPTAPPTTSRGANEANVGDCVRVAKGGVDAELEVLECGSPAAVYRVGLELERGEQCPTGPYTQYHAALGVASVLAGKADVNGRPHRRRTWRSIPSRWSTRSRR